MTSQLASDISDDMVAQWIDALDNVRRTSRDHPEVWAASIADPTAIGPWIGSQMMEANAQTPERSNAMILTALISLQYAAETYMRSDDPRQLITFWAVIAEMLSDSVFMAQATQTMAEAMEESE